MEDIIVEGLPATQGIDDLAIFVEMGESPQWLAAADYARTRQKSGLPYVGVIAIHPPLLDTTYTYVDWERVFIHEIAHVLGFEWEMFARKGLTENQGEQWYFTGAKAVDAYRQILYEAGEKLSYAITDLRVPLHSDGAHWHPLAMPWELLQPIFSNSAALSTVTLFKRVY